MSMILYNGDIRSYWPMVHPRRLCLRGLVGVVDVAFLHRRRPGGHTCVVLTKRAQDALFSGRTGCSQVRCRGSLGTRLVSFARSVRRNLPHSQVGRRMFSRAYTYPLAIAMSEAH